METAFLMVGLQTLVRPLLVWVCVFVCVSGIGDVSCKIVWLFVAVVTSMCEFQLFAACTPTALSARSISCSPLFRRDVVSGNRYRILERTLDGHGVRVGREQHGYLTGREEE